MTFGNILECLFLIPNCYFQIANAMANNEGLDMWDRSEVGVKCCEAAEKVFLFITLMQDILCCSFLESTSF